MLTICFLKMREGVKGLLKNLCKLIWFGGVRLLLASFSSFISTNEDGQTWSAVLLLVEHQERFLLTCQTMSPLPLSTTPAGHRWTSLSSTGFQRWPKVLTCSAPFEIGWVYLYYRWAAQASRSCWADSPLQMGSSLFGTQWTRWRWWLWTGRARRSWPTEWWPILRGAYSANMWLGRIPPSISYTSCLQ